MGRVLNLVSLAVAALLMTMGSPAFADSTGEIRTLEAKQSANAPNSPNANLVARYGPKDRIKSDSNRKSVTDAIWEASEKTGVRYEYLLAQAQIESGLNPRAKARGSSATGLFQFIDSTWIAMLDKKKGALEFSIPRSRADRLDLRFNVQAASFMAAAYAQDNARALKRVLGREANNAELYLAHFLGTGGATRFMSAWKANPHRSAAAMFPKAARSNRPIFYKRSGRARSLQQVLSLIGGKIDRALEHTLNRGAAAPGMAAPPAKTADTDSIDDHGFQNAEALGPEAQTRMLNAAWPISTSTNSSSDVQSFNLRRDLESEDAQTQFSSQFQQLSKTSLELNEAFIIKGLMGSAASSELVTSTSIAQHTPWHHTEMCYLHCMSTSTITRVRDLVNSGEMTRAGLARAAGLHANTLRDATEDDWNPTAETLQKLEVFLDSNDERPALVGIEEIIDEARNGRMYILVDDEDRENEGDLIIPAQMATPAAVNFMATHGRGLICLALDRGRVDELGLEPMSRNNKESMQTAFTISIEAKEGVTTGISAADRARTISVAIDSTKGSDDIVTPGHVFPLTARDGGTLVRAGHTEAAVDISRLAGLNPSGVICEVMNDDGSMARLDDLIMFARKHDLKIGTIRDLIAYRMRNDHLVERLNERTFESDYGGQWQMITYRDRVANDEAYVLQKGRVLEGEPTLARVHPISVFDDVLGAPGPRKRTLQRSMQAIGDHGSGVIVILTSRVGTGDAWTKDEEIRNIGIGSQILADLGVNDMILLSNSRPDLVALEGFGITITDFQSIPE